MSEYIVKETAYHLGTRQEVIGELIRCKDCEYWMPHSQLGYDEDNGTYHDYCAKLIPDDEYYAFPREANDFCSRAERRTDEVKKCDTCKHEKSRWFSRCADCSDYELWEEKDESS